MDTLNNLLSWGDVITNSSKEISHSDDDNNDIPTGHIYEYDDEL